MNIKFKSLHFENFLSYECADLQFNDLGYVFVKGSNLGLDSVATSNGSGKSTISEALIWCLTGETLRGTKDVVRYGSQGICSVTLDLLIDDVQYKITRTKNPSNLIIIANEKDISGKGIRDTEKILKDTLPDLNLQLIGSVIVLGQGLPQRFTSNTPSGRKEVLEKLSKSDFMINDLKFRISNRATILNTEIRTVEDTLLTNKTKIESLKINIDKYKEILSQLVKPDSSIISQLIDDITKQQSEIDTLKLKKKDTESKVSNLETELNDLKIKNLTDVQNKKDLFSNQIKVAFEQVSTLKQTINYKESELNKLKSILDVCPTCGQKLKDIEKPDTSKLELELSELRATLKLAQTEKQNLEATLSASIEEINASYKESILNKQIEAQATKSELNNQLSNIQAKESGILKLANQKVALETQLVEYDSKVKNYNDLIVDSTAQIKQLENDVLYNTNNLLDLKQRLEIIKKFETYIKRDFRGYLLQNVVDFINQTVQNYSKLIFDNEDLKFFIDGNDIAIQYKDKEYENLSGGERCRCDIIIQLALRKMLCSYLNFSSNLLIVDEIFDGLDNVGCDKITNFLYTQLKDTEMIYVISHRSDLPISYDTELIIEKDSNGISRIVQ